MNYNSYPYYQNSNFINNRNRNGGFLFPFALGFVSSPLIFGATRPRPPYYTPYYGPYYRPNYFPYY